MNTRNLEKALSRYFAARFEKANESERDRIRKSGIQEFLFTWQGHKILVRYKGVIFYEVLN